MDHTASSEKVSARLIALLSLLLERLEVVDDPYLAKAEVILKVIEIEVHHEIERLRDLPVPPPPFKVRPASPPDDLPF